jgi:hypothetical protein
VHGEPESKENLRNLLENEMGLSASVPEMGDQLEL